MMHFRFLLPLVFAGFAAAQILAPAQPTSGPGGDDYPYNVVQQGPLVAHGSSTLGPYSYYIFSPQSLGTQGSLPTPTTAPTILFIHGFPANSPLQYQFWLEHMARMGFNVIWVEYDSSVGPNDFAYTTAVDFNAAVTYLSQPGQINPLLDSSGNVLYSIVGHSAGGWVGLQLAAAHSSVCTYPKTTGNPPICTTVPIPKSIVAIEPTEGAIRKFPETGIDPNTLVITVVGDADLQGRQCDAGDAWTNLTQIPALFKPFLLVRSDAHGSPAQIGNHVFPLTDSKNDTVGPPISVDDRDYNVTYKLSVAGANCGIFGQQCDYAIGNGPLNEYGSTTQTFMGLWSDGTPVTPMVQISDPLTYFVCPPGS